MKIIKLLKSLFTRHVCWYKPHVWEDINRRCVKIWKCECGRECDTEYRNLYATTRARNWK